METTLRPTTSSSAIGTGSVAGASTSARLVPARASDSTGSTGNGAASAAGAVGATPLRGKATSVDGALQSQVARAQQAVDYLGRVAGQLETLKGELTAKLTGARNTSRQQLDAHARQLAATLGARRQNAGGSVDANLDYSEQPAVQRFRIRGLDIASLQQDTPQTLAFSVGGVGGPQLAMTLQPDLSSAEIAAALDRALAPMGVRARLDNQGGLVFSTPESNWPAVKDSIAVSGRGKVATDEVPAGPAPQQWHLGDSGGGADNLRQSLREVVQALERVRRSQDAANNALSAATTQVSATQTPPPQVELAAQDFASVAAGTDYESLLSLTSALVGVSRERVLALLGLH